MYHVHVLQHLLIEKAKTAFKRENDVPMQKRLAKQYHIELHWCAEIILHVAKPNAVRPTFPYTCLYDGQCFYTLKCNM